MPTAIALRTPTRGSGKRTGGNTRDTESLVIPMHSSPAFSGKRLGNSRDTESMVIQTADHPRTRTMDFSTFQQFDFNQSDRKGSFSRPTTSGSNTPNFSKRTPLGSKPSKDDISYSPFPLTSKTSSQHLRSKPSISSISSAAPKTQSLRKSSSYSLLTSSRSLRNARRPSMTPDPNMSRTDRDRKLSTPTPGTAPSIRSTWNHSPDSAMHQDQWHARLQRRPSRWMTLTNFFGMGKKRTELVPNTFYQVQPETPEPFRHEFKQGGHSPIIPGPEVPEKPYRNGAKSPMRPTTNSRTDLSKRPRPGIRRTSSLPFVDGQIPGDTSSIVESGPASIAEEDRESRGLPAVSEDSKEHIRQEERRQEKLDKKREEERRREQRRRDRKRALEAEESLRQQVEAQQTDPAAKEAAPETERPRQRSTDERVRQRSTVGPVEVRKEQDKPVQVSPLQQAKPESSPELEKPVEAAPEKPSDTTPEPIVEQQEEEEEAYVPISPIVPSVAPQLELNIPSMRMERYSIMFSGLFDDKSNKRASARASTLLSRRQANLDKLKTVDESTAEKVNPSCVKSSTVLTRQQIEEGLAKASRPMSSPTMRQESTLRPRTSPGAVSPMRSSFAGELERSFGMAFSSDPLPPVPEPATIPIVLAKQSVEVPVSRLASPPPPPPPREPVVDEKPDKAQFTPGSSQLILDFADSDDEQSGTQKDRKSRGKSIEVRRETPSMAASHSVSGSTSSSEASNASTWSNAPWSSAPSSEFSFASTIRPSSPQPSPKTASGAKPSTPRSATPLATTVTTPRASRSASVTPEVTTPRMKSSHGQSQSQTPTSTQVSPLVSPRTRSHTVATSSPLVTPKTTTTITAGSPEEAPERSSSKSPVPSVSSPLPPMILTHIPTLEPFDFGPLSSTSSVAEQRLTNAANVSIARQISISREQRKLLRPRTSSAGAVSPSNYESTVEIPPPLRIEKIHQMRKKASASTSLHTIAIAAADDGRKRSVSSPATDRKPSADDFTSEARKPGFYFTNTTPPVEHRKQTPSMYAADMRKQSAQASEAAVPASVAAPAPAPAAVSQPATPAGPERRKKSATPGESKERSRSRSQSQSQSQQTRDTETKASSKSRSGSASSHASKSSRVATDANKIWPDAATHWTARKSSISQVATSSSVYANTASPLKAALEANEEGLGLGIGIGTAVGNAADSTARGRDLSSERRDRKEVGHRYKRKMSETRAGAASGTKGTNGVSGTNAAEQSVANDDLYGA